MIQFPNYIAKNLQGNCIFLLRCFFFIHRRLIWIESTADSKVCRMKETFKRMFSYLSYCYRVDGTVENVMWNYRQKDDTCSGHWLEEEIQRRHLVTWLGMIWKPIERWLLSIKWQRMLKWRFRKEKRSKEEEKE